MLPVREGAYDAIATRTFFEGLLPESARRDESRLRPIAGKVNLDLGWTAIMGPMHVVTWLIPEDGHWCALAEDFDVVGMGASPEAACHNMDELLLDYLGLVVGEGGSPADARRPISLGRKARLEALLLRDRLRRHLHTHMDGVQRVRHDMRAPAHLAA